MSLDAVLVAHALLLSGGQSKHHISYWPAQFHQALLASVSWCFMISGYRGYMGHWHDPGCCALNGSRREAAEASFRVAVLSTMLMSQNGLVPCCTLRPASRKSLP